MLYICLRTKFPEKLPLALDFVGEMLMYVHVHCAFPSSSALNPFFSYDFEISESREVLFITLQAFCLLITAPLNPLFAGA